LQIRLLDGDLIRAKSPRFNGVSRKWVRRGATNDFSPAFEGRESRGNKVSRRVSDD
jgi:hypothetical protein